MNWDDLRIFLAVARGSTMAAAAQRLDIDATTVGRRLSRLAASLDTTLFEAGPGGQVLTERGRRLLAYAETVEQAAVEARSELTGERGTLAGTVRVSVSEGFGTWVVARHLAGFRETHPGITIDLVANSGFLNPSKREADLAIMLNRPARGPLITRQLSEYRLKLYASHDYAAQVGLPATPAELHGHALIGYIPDLIYADALRYLDEIEKDLEPTVRSSSINAQHGLTAASAGISVLPCFIGDQDPGLVRVLDAHVDIARSFWIVVHKDVRRLARVSAFIDWLNRLVREKRPLLMGEGR